MYLFIYINMPMFNTLGFLLNHFQGEASLQCYNASSEKYFQMRKFLAFYYFIFESFFN